MASGAAIDHVQTAAASRDRKTRVFISYSRKDSAFADRLVEALNAGGFDAYLDKKDILPGEPWKERLGRLILSADAVIFVISPESVSSETCAWEVEETERLQKKLLPVVHRTVADDQVPVRLSRLNYIFLRDQDDFAAGLRVLAAAIETDIAWIREHTRLSELARRWEDGERRNQALLRGDDIAQAERWRDARPREAPPAADTQLAYITASRRAATTRQRYAVIGSISVAAVAIVLATLAYWQRNVAVEQRDQALTTQSLFLGQMSRQQNAAGQHDLAMKLALYALPRRLDRPDRPWVRAAEAALLAAFAGQTFRFELGGPRTGLDSTLKQARISGDGLRVVLDYGGQAELWSLESGEMLRSLRSDDDLSFVEQVAFSPAGELLVISYVTMGEVRYGADYGLNGGATTVRGSLFDVVDARTGALLRRFQVEGHQRNHLAFSPTGKRLFLSTDRRMMVLDTTAWEEESGGAWDGELAAWAPPYAQVLFSEDEHRLALMTRGGSIAVLDLTTSSFAEISSGQKDAAQAIFRGRAGDTLFVAAGQQVTSYDVSGMLDAIKPDGADASDPASRIHPLRSKELPLVDANPVVAIGFSPKRESAVALTQDGCVHFWRDGKDQADSNSCQTNAGHVRSAALSGDAEVALVELADGTVEYRVLSAGTHRRLLASGARQLLGAEFTRDANRVLFATNESRVYVWDPALTHEDDNPRLVSDALATVAAFSPRPGLAVYGTPDGGVATLDLAAGRSTWQGRSGHQGAVGCVAFDPAGLRVVSGGADHLALIWTPGQNQPPKRLEGHRQNVDFCAFSPDGRLVVTGSRDSTFRLWDAATGDLRHVLAIPQQYLDPIHNASIYPRAVFAAGGSRLVTVTAGDGYIITQPALVWDVASGQLIHALPHPEGAIWDLQLMPDGQHVVTASYDKTAVLWDLVSGKRVQPFTGHSSRVLRAVPTGEGRLLVATTAEGIVDVYHVAGGQLVHQWRMPANLFNVAVSHNGRFIALASNVADKGPVIELWDAVVGVRLATIAAPEQPLQPLVGLAFGLDDASLLASTRTNQLYILDLPPTGQALIDQAWERVGSGRELLTREQRVRFAIDPP
jgi:WD40 repeat protein